MKRLVLLLVVCVCLRAHEGRAAGTPAGTSVVNQAQVTYTQNGVPASGVSNATTLTVAEILDVNVTLQSAQVSVIAGEVSRTLLFRVTNIGNGTETLPFAIDNLIAGDDFDPLAAVPAIYFDTDGSGSLTPADVVYVSGTNDVVLAADAGVGVLLVNDMPAGIADGQLGRSRLSARAATGTGTPGTTFPGQGTGGTDALAGASGAAAAATGEYVVGDVQVAVVKSATVVDPAGGSRPVPGARIDYQVVVNVNGSGTARAVDFDDAIPANTTYLPGTLRLNGAALTDVADGDGGEFQPGAAPRVRVALGDLTQGSGARTVAFAVIVN